jgi:hypothetical protein
MGHILTAVSMVHQRSAGRGLWQRKRFDPEKWKKGKADVLLTRLSRMGDPLFLHFSYIKFD